MFEMPGYRTLGVIGNSGDIKLYRLMRFEDGRTVIAKTTSDEYPGPVMVDTFRYEYDMLKKLGGRGTVEVFSLEIMADRPVLLLQDMEGNTLDRVLRSQAKVLDLSSRLRIAAAAADCLMQLHRDNIMLNELTPSHLMVNPVTYEVKLIDIRMCSTDQSKSPMSQSMDRPDAVLSYISPEQTGRTGVTPDYRSDFYSLGVILYECLSGSLPFELQDVIDIVYRHLAGTPEPLHQRFPSIPQSVSDIVSKCMEKMPEARYASAFGIKTDLEECVARLQAAGQVESFVLASRDIPKHWTVPVQFYGRQSEQRSLQEALQRASAGAVETVWVSGNGGIGKTSFIKETLQKVVPIEGFFAMGKFNPYHTAHPYDIWNQLIDALVSQLLMETKLQAEVWKLRILKALDGYGALLIDLVPRLEMLIGQQPFVQPLPPMEAKERFHQILNRFIQLFLHRDRPLILFFDNVQWADEASLQYLSFLLEDRGTKHLLVALAYRNDREITDLHPLSRFEKNLVDRNIKKSSIPLSALNLADLKQWLSDAMRYDAADNDELAKVLFHKTEGNPFFLKQFLQDLIDDKQVTFDESSRCWRWDIQLITEMNVPDNAAAYLSDKLRLLSNRTLFILGRAAFLGSHFQLDMLSSITDLPIEELIEVLHIAVGERLLQPVSSGEAKSYKFQHVRIHQAAYALVSEEEVPDLHLKIGVLLLDRMKISDDVTIFEVVNHMNQAVQRIECSEQCQELVELNLQAGLKAKQSTAYETSLGYLRHATALLKEEHWDQHYELFFQVLRERAELEYLCAHFDIADDLFQLLISRAATNMDKARVYVMKIQLEASNDNYEEVISLGRNTMELLNLNHNFDPGSLQLTLQWLRLSRKLRKHPIDSIRHLPPMTDEVRKVAMSVLVYTSKACFFVNRKGWLASSFTMVEMTLDYGITPEASIGFVGYAMFQYYHFRNDEETFKWGMLACDISKPYPTFHMMALTSFSLCYNSWRRFDPSMLNTFTEHAGQMGLESGDLWQGNQSVLINCASLFQYGHPLGDIYDRLISHSGDFLRHNNPLHCKQVAVFIAFLVRLTGNRSPDDPFEIVNISEMEYGESVHGDSFHVIEDLVWIYQYLSGYLFGQYREANEALIKSGAILESRPHHVDYALQYFYESLVWAQLYEEASPREQRVYWIKMRIRLKKMRKMALRCPENYQHKYLLIKAEMARLSHKNRQAEELYEQSIEVARMYGHTHDLAITAECYGRHGLHQGKLHLAKIYMTEAYEAYLQWGALAKAVDMEGKYPNLLNVKRESGLDHVDSLSVAKSAQALSGEMEMSRLLVTLMRIMIHNAGADYGAVIIDHEGRWMIEAYGTADKINIESVPLEEESDIVPAAIIGYAARTQEEIVLHHAASQGMFARNSYVRDKELKSVLCLPIMNQNNLICLLYMENKLSPGIFTPQRLDVLKLLGSQCAISIANAKLYSGIQYLKKNLEVQVEERTRSLERSMHEASAALAEVSVYEERNRIAQEIHDIVGHTLTSTILQIEAGKRLLYKDMENGVQRLNEAQDLVRRSLNEIRGSVHMLKEDKYANLSIMLNQLIWETERNAGVVIHANIYELPELMSTAYKKTIYHALQEGLTNGIRHGRSTEFRFNLEPVGESLQFRLEDRGIGTDGIVMGFGLKAMKDRVEQLGGSLFIDSGPNQGCLLRIDLPYQMRWIGERV